MYTSISFGKSDKFDINLKEFCHEKFECSYMLSVYPKKGSSIIQDASLNIHIDNTAQLYDFVDKIFKAVYDEKTFDELANENIRLQNRIDELEEEIDNLKANSIQVEVF